MSSKKKAKPGSISKLLLEQVNSVRKKNNIFSLRDNHEHLKGAFGEAKTGEINEFAYGKAVVLRIATNALDAFSSSGAERIFVRSSSFAIIFFAACGLTAIL